MFCNYTHFCYVLMLTAHQFAEVQAQKSKVPVSTMEEAFNKVLRTWARYRASAPLTTHYEQFCAQYEEGGKPLPGFGRELAALEAYDDLLPLYIFNNDLLAGSCVSIARDYLLLLKPQTDYPEQWLKMLSYLQTHADAAGYRIEPEIWHVKIYLK